MTRHPTLETVDGEDCVRIPLGRKGKDGSCFMLRASWERYISDNHSQKLRLVGGSVFNGSNQSVAKIIAEADGRRVEYANGNRRDLRLHNLRLVAGKSGPRVAPRGPKSKRSKKVPVEFCDAGGLANTPIVVPFGFHTVALWSESDRLDKDLQKILRNGGTLRDPEIAKREIYLMLEQEKALRPWRADNYHPANGGKRSNGKVERFGKK